MTIYHLNPKTLEVGVCQTVTGKCPFGENLHYTSEESARIAVESKLPTFKELTPKLIAAKLESDGYAPATLTDFIREQKRWTKNEKRVLEFTKEAFADYNETSRVKLQAHMSKIAGLHFAKELLSDKELVILQHLEDLQKYWLLRIEKVQE